MSLKFRYVPLTFITDEEQIKVQIKNTIILKYFFDKNKTTVKLKKLIAGTQYGYNASALDAGSNKFLRISDISDGKVDWATVPYCDCLDEETYLLEQEDLLIARTGGTTGKSFLITNPPKKSVFAGYLIRIRANKETAPEFLNLFLNSYVYWSQITSLNKGEFRPSVNATKLKNLLLPKCNKQEQLDAIKLSQGAAVADYQELQKEISTALQDYEKCKLISTHIIRQKELTHKLKKSILQDAIQGKLTEDWRNSNDDVEPASELLQRIKIEKALLIKEKKIQREKKLSPITVDEIPFKIPENWIWCRLGEITNYGSSEKIESVDINSNTWVLDLEDIEKETSKIIQRKTFKERPSLSTKSIFKKGWVLYSKLRPYLDKVVVVDNDGVCTTEILPLPIYSNLNPTFLMFGLKGKNFLKYVNSKVSGMKMPRLKTPDGKMAIIPIAPVEEQKAIVEKVENLLQKCNYLEQEIKQSEQYANILIQSVLKEAFEGKIEQETEVVQLSFSQELEEKHFVKRKMLASYIINHSANDDKFGDTKFEKLLHLSDYHILKRNFGQEYKKKAAGPYDNKFTVPFFNQTIKAGWFYKQPLGNMNRILQGKNNNKSQNTYDFFSDNELERIDELIETFKNSNYEKPEIISTIYAVWNNRIIRNQQITDELLKQDFLDWDKGKAQYVYPKDRVTPAIKWMKEKGFVPNGWGKVIELPKSKNRKTK